MLVPCLVGVLVQAGCGGGTPSGTVAGKVTFHGSPVREGRVSFFSENSGIAEEALLDTEGRFALARPLPVGEYKVMVMPLIVHERVDPKGPVVGEEKPAPDIPQKYRARGSTDLKAVIVEGPNEVKLDMIRER
jgi:hypothetical protein